MEMELCQSRSEADRAAGTETVSCREMKPTESDVTSFQFLLQRWSWSWVNTVLKTVWGHSGQLVLCRRPLNWDLCWCLSCFGSHKTGPGRRCVRDYSRCWNTAQLLFILFFLSQCLCVRWGLIQQNHNVELLNGCLLNPTYKQYEQHRVRLMFAPQDTFGKDFTHLQTTQCFL